MGTWASDSLYFVLFPVAPMLTILVSTDTPSLAFLNSKNTETKKKVRNSSGFLVLVPLPTAALFWFKNRKRKTKVC